MLPATTAVTVMTRTSKRSSAPKEITTTTRLRSKRPPSCSQQLVSRQSSARLLRPDVGVSGCRPPAPSPGHPPSGESSAHVGLRASTVSWAAGESFALSQSYYVGRIEGRPTKVIVTDGRRIDLCDHLDAGRLYKNGANAPSALKVWDAVYDLDED